MLDEDNSGILIFELVPGQLPTSVTNSRAQASYCLQASVICCNTIVALAVINVQLPPFVSQAWGKEGAYSGPVVCWAYLTLHGIAGQNTERKIRLQLYNDKPIRKPRAARGGFGSMFRRTAKQKRQKRDGDDTNKEKDTVKDKEDGAAAKSKKKNDADADEADEDYADKNADDSNEEGAKATADAPRVGAVAVLDGAIQRFQRKDRTPYPSTMYVTVDPLPIKGASEDGGSNRGDADVADAKVRGAGAYGNHDPPEWMRPEGTPCLLPTKLQHRIASGERGCLTLAFSNEGVWMAVGAVQADSFPINIYHISDSSKAISEETNTLECTLVGHNNLIYDLCWSKDDSRLLSASSDGTARLWDTHKFSAGSIKTLPHPCFVYCARFRPGASQRHKSQAVTGAFDGIIRVWNLVSEGPTAELVQELHVHRANINSIVFDSRGMKMYSADGRGTILLWETEAAHENDDDTFDPQMSDHLPWEQIGDISDVEVKDDAITNLQIHPKGKHMLVHARDNIIRMLDLRSELFIQRYKGCKNSKEWSRSCFSACGALVIAGSGDGTAFAWSTETGEQVYKYQSLGMKEGISDVAFHPHDHILAFASFGTSQPILLYHFKQGTEPITSFAPAVNTTLPRPVANRSLMGTTIAGNDAGPRTDLHEAAPQLNLSMNMSIAADPTQPMQLDFDKEAGMHSLSATPLPRDAGKDEIADLVSERERIVEAVLDSTMNAMKHRRETLMSQASTPVPLMANILGRSSKSPSKSSFAPGDTASQLESEYKRHLANDSSVRFADEAGAEGTGACTGTILPLAVRVGTGARSRNTPATAQVAITLYQAKFAYTSTREDELSFTEGDRIVIETKREGKSWWYGHLQQHPAQKGMVAVTYIEPAQARKEEEDRLRASAENAFASVFETQNIPKDRVKNTPAQTPVLQQNQNQALNTTSNPTRSSLFLPPSKPVPAKNERDRKKKERRRQRAQQVRASDQDNSWVRVRS